VADREDEFFALIMACSGIFGVDSGPRVDPDRKECAHRNPRTSRIPVGGTEFCISIVQQIPTAVEKTEVPRSLCLALSAPSSAFPATS